MKLKESQTLDQNIIKMLADHKGIDRAIRGEVLAQSLNIDLRTLQSRISSLQKKRCAIGTIDGLGGSQNEIRHRTVDISHASDVWGNYSYCFNCRNAYRQLTILIRRADTVNCYLCGVSIPPEQIIPYQERQVCDWCEARLECET